MSLESEEDFLDTELRNVFHNYDLSPAEHSNVWAGVEARITHLPAARTGLPAQLLLPLTAAVLGVAVGWLLPHPAARSGVAPATATAPRTVLATAPAPLLSQPTGATAARPTLALAKVSLPIKAHIQLITNSINKLRTMRRANLPTRVDKATNPSTAQPATVTDSSETVRTTVVAVASDTPLAAVTDSLPAVALDSPMPTENRLASPLPMADRPVKEPKPKGSNEKIGYHKPTNRQPEQGQGIHRWFSHLTQTMHHVVGI